MSDKATVAVLGAAGGIGQPLSLLLALNPLVGDLRLYDIVNTPGVAADLSHIDGSAKVSAYLKDEQLPQALKGAHLVVIPAGVPRKPGMTRDDLFNINAGIVKTLVQGCADHCPDAWIAVISNPVNSTVPIAAEILRKAGVYNPRKLFGVTTLDVVRANRFLSEALGLSASDVNVPVVGGHAGITILPLLSQAKPDGAGSLPQERIAALTERIQNAGTEVVEAKAGTGSATLSMAYAAAKFSDSCLKAIAGAKDIVECSFVDSKVSELPFFASRVALSKDGIQEYLPVGALSAFEEEQLGKMKTELGNSINKGIEFARNKV